MRNLSIQEAAEQWGRQTLGHTSCLYLQAFQAELTVRFSMSILLREGGEDSRSVFIPLTVLILPPMAAEPSIPLPPL